MGLPSAKEARRFYRAGQVRREEAGVLRERGYATGAVYLAGYAAECMLKTLLLGATPRGRRAEVFAGFRGAGGHDLRRLRARYAAAAGGTIPNGISLDLLYLSRWTTDLRYSPKAMPDDFARDFLAATDRVLAWADARV